MLSVVDVYNVTCYGLFVKFFLLLSRSKNVRLSFSVGAKGFISFVKLMLWFSPTGGSTIIETFEFGFVVFVKVSPVFVDKLVGDKDV